MDSGISKLPPGISCWEKENAEVWYQGEKKTNFTQLVQVLPCTAEEMGAEEMAKGRMKPGPGLLSYTQLLLSISTSALCHDPGSVLG